MILKVGGEALKKIIEDEVAHLKSMRMKLFCTEYIKTIHTEISTRI